jgi:hypothetical protein
MSVGSRTLPIEARTMIQASGFGASPLIASEKMASEELTQ